MITRPLDVSTRLKPPPKNFDYLFWVNGVLIALFFTFFGSRFVLSPGMGIAKIDQILPSLTHSAAGAVATQLRLDVAEGGKLYVDTGLISLSELKGWLFKQSEKTPGATLLVRYNVANSAELLTEIANAALDAKINVQLAAVDRGANANDTGASHE